MNWRLFLDGAASGARNMAIDEALLLCATPGSTPILRFYSWNPPCVSLGRFQNIESLNSSLVTRQSPLVRRPTGGRAIWHQHEITYAAVLREEILPPDARSVVGSYEWLSRGFIAGLQELGVPAQLAPSEAKAARTENCFASAARSDFVVDGRKLIGAAQCRKNGALLQHGSLLLDIDEDAWRDAVGGSLQGMISLSHLGVRASRDEIIAALCAGVAQTLGATFTTGALSAAQAQMALTLENEKYTLADWNLRGKQADSTAQS
jgi:lipoate-protein ligase A